MSLSEAASGDLHTETFHSAVKGAFGDAGRFRFGLGGGAASSMATGSNAEALALLTEAIEKGWWGAGYSKAYQTVEPRVLFEAGGNMLRRNRGGQKLLLEHHPRIQAALFWHVAESEPRRRIDGFAVPGDGSFVRVHQTEDAAHRSGFPGAVFSNDAKHLSFMDGEVYMTQRPKLFVWCSAENAGYTAPYG